jgi:spore coat polysaccharide biosynthesis protein SpsF (cytidylyltransferase family)
MPNCLSNKEYRFTIDTKEDAKIIKEILCGFNDINFNYLDIIRKIKKNNYLQVKMFKNIQLNIK